MKKSEIKHITDTTTSPENDPELVFTGYVNKNDGMLADAFLTNSAALSSLIAFPKTKPEDWDNVRHITGNLFYAFETDKPTDGKVYIGKFV